MTVMNRLPILVPALLMLAACAQQRVMEQPTRAETTSTTTASIVSTNDNLNAVAWTQTAIEHDMIYLQAYRDAGERLDQALADPTWDALSSDERGNTSLRNLKPAVILDIDETALDNSPYQARLVLDGNSFDEFTWAQWCKEQKARAMPGAVEFARNADSKGVTVFYLSNRAADLNDVTLANLAKVGFPIKAGENVFLGLGTLVEDCEQNGSEKGCRRKLVAQNYRVLMQIGDQIGDFVDVLANTADGRKAAVAPYLNWVGERWFVLPNPTYGSWEPALFNNAWSQPADVRRQGKLDGLHRD
ncbi:MAG: HAD family acid phosphatase [Dokdonella sp.]